MDDTTGATRSRRQFLKKLLSRLALAAAAGPMLRVRAARAAARAGAPAARPFAASAKGFDCGPIAGLADVQSSIDFNGDQMDHPHDVLWNKDEWLRGHGGIPEPSERVGIVIVGGGIAGLVAAYALRDLNPILLEQASRLGGNSKAEALNVGGASGWLDSGQEPAVYSLGAAYITRPDEGSPIATLLTELGLRGAFREEAGPDAAVLANGAIVPGFWSGHTDLARAGEFQRVFAALERVRSEAYPAIPFDPSGPLSLDAFLKLDSIPFSQWVAETLGPIHPHIDEYFHHYCWSSLAGDCDELSAAQVLSFLAGDLAGTLALQGGNARIADSLMRRLDPSLVRPGALVVDIAPAVEGVRICYEQGGQPRSILERACVVAAPKFVAKGLLSGLSFERSEAMNHVKTRAYIVANIILKGPITSRAYDVFRVTGQVPNYPRHDIETRGYTDVVFGSWAGGDRAGTATLTLYRALPWDGARQFLFNPNAHEKHLAIIQRDLPELFHALGLPPDAIAAVRLTRWGHALPIAATGALARGIPQSASAPIGGRVFFANQDNWANPCFETATLTALQAATDARVAATRAKLFS